MTEEKKITAEDYDDGAIAGTMIAITPLVTTAFSIILIRKIFGEA